MRGPVATDMNGMKRQGSISVIIPSFNEAELLRGSIQSALGQEGVLEVIVVDGGSDDGTREQARDATIVLESARGRSIQMNLGARAAQGDILAFLHADSRLPPSYSLEVFSALEDPRVVGGCAPIRFHGESVFLGAYSWLSRLPVRFFHYGDGALFIRRSAFDWVGGYSEIQLMEDLTMIRALGRIGKFTILESPVSTSSRRFREGGTVRTQLRNILLVGLFLLGVDPHRLKAFYPDVR